VTDHAKQSALCWGKGRFVLTAALLNRGRGPVRELDASHRAPLTQWPTWPNESKAHWNGQQALPHIYRGRVLANPEIMLSNMRMIWDGVHGGGCVWEGYGWVAWQGDNQGQGGSFCILQYKTISYSTIQWQVGGIDSHRPRHHQTCTST
jgi:hypothetical protein